MAFARGHGHLLSRSRVLFSPTSAFRPGHPSPAWPPAQPQPGRRAPIPLRGYFFHRTWTLGRRTSDPFPRPQRNPQSFFLLSRYLVISRREAAIVYEEIEAKEGLPSADRNNKATLLLTGPFRTSKSSAKDLTPLVLKLQFAKYHYSLREQWRNRLLRR